MLYFLYRIFGFGLFFLLFPGIWFYKRIRGQHCRHLAERFGHVPEDAVKRLSDSPRIWIHAVSLGEVKVAGSIIEALKRLIPGCSIIVSSMTEHGRNLAREAFGNEIAVVYAPIDLLGPVRKALSAIRPDVLVFLETEIWPAWLFEAKRMGIKTALINGRISVRSIDRYLRLRPFFREVLKNFDLFSMISEEDARRVRSMGAPSQKIVVNGNAKYDTLKSDVGHGVAKKIRKLLNLETSQKVFIAGSTRHGEEEMVLNAYEKVLKEFPETILIIVPRHIERATAITSMIEGRGLKCRLRTEIGSNRAKRTEQVIVIDSFGELFDLYSVGTVVFCGASLVPLGGQNPLEPAVWGGVVLYGPSMEDFSDAKDLLESAGASVPVSGPEELGEKAVWLLGHPEEAKKYGERAREVVLRNRGVAQRHAKAIEGLLRCASLRPP